MNAKQAMRKAKKLAEQEAAARAYPLFNLIQEMDKLEWTDDERAGECLVARWPYAKEELKAQMADGKKLDLDAVMIRVPEGVSVNEEQLQVDFSNLMNEADMFFENAKRYEEEISFFQDMLEMFELSGKENKLTRDNFTSAIGAGYHYLGRKDMRDRYFTELLASQDRNDYVAAKYAGLLLEDRELEKAEEFLKDYRDSTDDMMRERFEWLEEEKSQK